MSTYDEILTAAQGYNAKIIRDGTFQWDPEGIAVVNRALLGLISFGVRYNPEHFATNSPALTPYSIPATGWVRPTDALLIFHAERASDDARVTLVTVQERNLMKYKPSVYYMGRVFRYASIITAADAINFWYARKPVQAATLGAPLDTLWEDDFDALLALETALVALSKDGRVEEATFLIQERNRWLGNWVAYLRDLVVPVVARHRRSFESVELLRSTLVQTPEIAA